MIKDTSPLLSVTPLYHFSSAADEIQIGEGIDLCRFDFDDVHFDDEVSLHLKACHPDFLLWYDPFISGHLPAEQYRSYVEGIRDNEGGDLLNAFLHHTTLLFLSLRLFKPGRLRAGDTFLVLRDRGGAPFWRALGSGRSSIMPIDYRSLSLPAVSYTLTPADAPFLLAFAGITLPLLRSLSAYPELATALSIYSADNGEELDLVMSATAFEALLTKKEEREGLAHRLASRIANLLGSDPDSRRSLFKDVKALYGLRSDIVHGSPMAKVRDRLSSLDSVRETLRLVLLSVISLYADGKKPSEVPDLLDDLAFDDELRTRTRVEACKLVHLVM